MPFHQATYLAPPPPHLFLCFTLSPPSLSSLLHLHVLVAPPLKGERPSAWQINPFFLLASVRVSLFHLCLSSLLSFSLCLLWEQAEEQSAGVYVKEYTERRRRQNKQRSPPFFPSPVFSLLYFFYFLNSNALFFPLALANHSSLIKLLQKSLSMSLDVISLLAAWILSLTHANAPPFLSIPSASKVFHCCDCQKETLLGSVWFTGLIRLLIVLK